MAALSTIHPTLLDFKNRLDSNDKVAKIIEILNLQNEVIDDAVFLEGNLLTGHKTNIRTGLPTPTWRKLYGGVQPTKSVTAQITDSCGMLEAYAEVDKALADLNGNTASFRLSEDLAHIEGMNQAFASTLFYGDSALTPEKFTGLAPRFNSLAAENGGNILRDTTIDNADNTSMYLVVWGANTVHGIYPKGSKAGLQMEDKGQVTIENVDAAYGRMEGYRTHYRWDVGLCVRDWRYVVRMQINQEDLKSAAATSGPDLVDLMTQAIELIPNLGMGRPAFYVNRNVRSFLRRQIANRTINSTLNMENVAGKHVLTFDGIPVRRCDALLNTESTVGA